MKTCRICRQEKAEAEFYARTPGVLRRECKACWKVVNETRRKANPEKHRARVSRYRAANRERTNAARRDWNNRNKESLAATDLKQRFGLTVADFNRMAEAQGHVCLICGNPELKRSRLSVDHCHTTGKIRGLLCNSCNTLLGMAKDSPSTLNAAAAYLEARA